jgi:hypothetical protein
MEVTSCFDKVLYFGGQGDCGDEGFEEGFHVETDEELDSAAGRIEVL